MAVKKPKVLVIGTGGAISARPVGGKWKFGEIQGGELVRLLPEIGEKFDIKTANLFRMDSSDMKPEHWLTLSNYIYYKMGEFDGIVVTMGTDTMQYAASAVSFLIQDNNIPIVFTGSQVDPAQPSSDAATNLADAITVAGKSDIAETIIVFDGVIMRATRAKKVNASEFKGFMSFEWPLGRIQNFIEMYAPYRKRAVRKPMLYNSLDTEVATLKVYPGFDGRRIIHLVDYPITGLVLEGFGLGNLPLLDTHLKEGIRHANMKNVPVVVTSDCALGAYWKHIYAAEIGSRLKGLKAIPVYDMLTEAAYVKLMWVLSQTKDYDEVKRIMQKSFAGEISPLENGKPAREN